MHIILCNDSLGCQSGEDTFTEPKVQLRFVFRLGHSGTSYRNDSILPNPGQSMAGAESYQKVIIYKVSNLTTLARNDESLRFAFVYARIFLYISVFPERNIIGQSAARRDQHEL